MRHQLERRWWRAPSAAATLLGVAVFVVAFSPSQLSHGLQQTAGGEHEAAAAVAAAQAAAAAAAAAAPMMTLAGEAGSALESAAALNADDLLAAESSQSPADAPDAHKAFTSGQMMRQEPQQHMAASVAPVFAAPPQQQQAQQQPQQQMYAQQAPHMAARLQPPHKANFNPFMAAALAGNYGPAQQQIAAAALHAQQQGGQVGPPPGHHAHQAPPAHHAHAHHQAQAAQQHHQQAMHAQQQASAHHQAQQQQAQQAQAQQQQQQLMHAQQQQHQMMPPQQQQQAMAVQESSVRHNVVAAPAAQFQHHEPQPPVELNEINGPQQGQQQTGLAVAASGQHPAVVAPSGVGVGSSSGQEAQAWPLQAPDIPKIVNLEVKCEKNLMKVSVEFDKIFNGVIFSKGHFSQGQCVHVGPQSNKQQAYFDISINSCGTQGNTQNGLYGMGQNTGSGTFFENTIVIQYDPNVQEVYDHARKLRCTWHDQYEKAVTFRPFPVDMLDIVRADFAGDNVGCWMQIQVGKGPWASEVAGIVKIGQTMTMVLAIKDEENKFDMLVRNCFAHDGKRGPIELVDKSGCITRPKLMSRFTKIKNFGSSATVLSYAHFQAFKFPDSMEVHFQCTIQICRHQCPEQCASGPQALGGAGGSSAAGEAYSESTISGTMSLNGAGGAGGAAAGAAAALMPGHADSVHLRKYGSPALSRARREAGAADGHNHNHHHQRRWSNGSHYQHGNNGPRVALTQTVGVNRVIQVVSTGDLAFAIQRQQAPPATVEGAALEDSQASQLTRLELTGGQICMSSYNFVLALVMLALILLCSAMLAISLYVRQRSLLAASGLKAAASCSWGAQARVATSSLNKLFQRSHQQQQPTRPDCHSPALSSQQSISNQHVPSKHTTTTPAGPYASHNQFYSGQ